MFKQKYDVTLRYWAKLEGIEATSEADALKKARKMVGITAERMKKFADNSTATRAISFGRGLTWADR